MVPGTFNVSAVALRLVGLRNCNRGCVAIHGSGLKKGPGDLFQSLALRWRFGRVLENAWGLLLASRCRGGAVQCSAVQWAQAAVAFCSEKRSLMAMNWGSILQKASMIAGSNWVPESWRMMDLATSWAKEFL